MHFFDEIYHWELTSLLFASAWRFEMIEDGSRPHRVGIELNTTTGQLV